MSKKLLAGVVVIIALSPAVPGQESELVKQMVANRSEAHLENRRLVGRGAGVVKSAIDGAQFVLIGEDHGVKEIAQFISSLCDLTGPQGFHTMAVETGPAAAALLNHWVTSDNRAQQVASFEKRFPNSIAFYNMREENELLAHCAQTATGGQFQLWGLDQEFLGAAGYLLHLIGETHPSKDVQAALDRLLSENEQAEKKANETHNPQDLFMFAASDAKLSQFKALLAKGASPRARALFDAVLESRNIYRKHFESGFDSNRERALLMKHNFAEDFAEFDYSTDKDSQFRFLKPAFENLEPSGWTVFDLRPLRRAFGSFGQVDPDMEKVILGYDLLVVIPVATPSSQIQ